MGWSASASCCTPPSKTPPRRAHTASAISKCAAHLRIAEGLELVIAPSRAQLNPEQLRQFARLVMQAHAQVMQADTDTPTATPPDNAPLRKHP